jgi:glycyl-tRNA synthetase beta chain
LFATGGRPTGDKDPFALRRAGLGLLRIIIEGGLELDLVDCIRSAAAEFKTAAEEVESLVEDVYRFLMERLRAYYQERGIRGDVIEAVLVKRSCSPLDIDRRVAAVQRFLELPAAASLAATNKRIANILRQAGGAPEQALDRERIREPAERALLDAVLGHEAEVVPMLERGDYQSALTTLAELKAPVDRFFDEVLVMTEDPAERANRLALLARLSTLFLHTADLSHIQTSHG